MNTELFRKIRESIVAEPDRLEMTYWEIRRPTCGTTRCMAGWAIHHTINADLYHSPRKHSAPVVRLADQLGVPDNFEDIGMELLGLTVEEAFVAFYLNETYALRFIELAAEGKDDMARQVLAEWTANDLP